jgi:hypothetical protein
MKIKNAIVMSLASVHSHLRFVSSGRKGAVLPQYIPLSKNHLFYQLFQQSKKDGHEKHN